jgi:hypothetical protein
VELPDERGNGYGEHGSTDGEADRHLHRGEPALARSAEIPRFFAHPKPDRSQMTLDRAAPDV